MEGVPATRDPDHYLAASGKPFGDPAAADMKAMLLQNLNGAEYSVVKYEGGWAVKKGAAEKLKAQTPEVATSHKQSPVVPAVNSGKVIAKKSEIAPVVQQRQSTVKTEAPIKGAKVLETPVSPVRGDKKRNRILTLRPSFRYYPKQFTAAVLGFVAAISSQRITAVILDMIGDFYPEILTPERVSVAIMGIGGFICLRGVSALLIARYNRKYIVSANAVESYVGILRRERHIIKIRDIRFILCKQSTWGRISNTGNVEMASAGGASLVDVEFIGISQPNTLAQRIEILMEENQHGRE